MLRNLKDNLHWFIISVLILGSFFIFCYVFIWFGGNLNFSLGNSYNTFTASGESVVRTSDPDISNVDPAVNAARAEAFQNAATIATELSKLSGLKLGKITSVSEYLDRNPIPTSTGPDLMPKPATSEASLKMSVTVTYEIN